MRALGLGVVVETGPDSKLRKGDSVSGSFGMTEYAVVNDSEDVEKLMYVYSELKVDAYINASQRPSRRHSTGLLEYPWTVRCVL